jgi:hypothetical protein
MLLPQYLSFEWKPCSQNIGLRPEWGRLIQSIVYIPSGLARRALPSLAQNLPVL